MSLNMSKAATTTVATDQGLRSYLTGVYNRLFGGLLLTALLAWLASVPPLRDLFFHVGANHHLAPTPLGWIVEFAPLLLIFLLGGAARSNEEIAGVLYWTTAALFGLSLGAIVYAYTSASLALTFVVTAAGFGGLSLWGYTTKRNLDAWGSALFMGLASLLVVMVLNIFLHLPGIDFLITLAGIVIFAGYTAYDTQKLKENYLERLPQDMAAFGLYLDVINLFLFLLRILGVMKSDD